MVAPHLVHPWIFLLVFLLTLGEVASSSPTIKWDTPCMGHGPIPWPHALSHGNMGNTCDNNPPPHHKEKDKTPPAARGLPREAHDPRGCPPGAPRDRVITPAVGLFSVVNSDNQTPMGFPIMGVKTFLPTTLLLRNVSEGPGRPLGREPHLLPHHQPHHVYNNTTLVLLLLLG